MGKNFVPPTYCVGGDNEKKFPSLTDGKISQKTKISLNDQNSIASKMTIKVFRNSKIFLFLGTKFETYHFYRINPIICNKTCKMTRINVPKMTSFPDLVTFHQLAAP